MVWLFRRRWLCVRWYSRGVAVGCACSLDFGSYLGSWRWVINFASLGVPLGGAVFSLDMVLMPVAGWLVCGVGSSVSVVFGFTNGGGGFGVGLVCR